MATHPPNAERGTAAVEACAAALFFVSTISGFFFFAYVSFARAWTDHVTYEAAVCAAREESPAVCERRLRASLEGVLTIGRVTFAHAEKSEGAAEAHAVFRVTDKWATNSRRRLTLPLAAGNVGQR